MERFTAYCYIMKKHGVFFAATPTLNLTAVGNTMDEAKRELHNAIQSYLETVVNKNFDIKTDRHLLKREAPMYMYLEYGVCLIATLIATLISKTVPLFSFEEPLPLTYCMAR